MWVKIPFTNTDIFLIEIWVILFHVLLFRWTFEYFRALKFPGLNTPIYIEFTSSNWLFETVEKEIKWNSFI